MILRLFIIGMILISFAIHHTNAQNTTTSTNEPGTFPATWQGQWSGDLEIYNPKGLAQTIPMELHILPIENTKNYTWTLIYGKDDKRSYELQPVDPENGIYLIDEKNSIKIETYYVSGILYSRFSAASTLISTRLEKEGDHLIFEIVSGGLEPASITGGETVEGEEIFEVKTYPVMGRHRALLGKIK